MVSGQNISLLWLQSYLFERRPTQKTDDHMWKLQVCSAVPGLAKDFDKDTLDELD